MTILSDSNESDNEEIQINHDPDYLDNLLDLRDYLLESSVEFEYLRTYSIHHIIEKVQHYFNLNRKISTIIPYMSPADEHDFSLFLHSILDLDENEIKITISDVYEVQNILKKKGLWMIY